MRKLFFYFFILSIFFIPDAMAADTSKDISYKLAIPFFSNLIKPEDSGISDNLVKGFTNEFKSLPNFIIIENEIIPKLMTKLKILSSDIINTDQIIDIGKETGADLLLTGSIMPIEKNITFNFRLIDTQTGKIIATKKFVANNESIGPVTQDFARYIYSLLNKRKINPSVFKVGNDYNDARIYTIPPGATVVLDDQPVGKSPLTLKGLTAGEHKLTTWISEPITSAEAVIDSVPSGVTVSQEDQDLGITPVTIKNLSPGSVYLNFSSQVKSKIQIKVNSLPGGVPVALDGEVIAKTPGLITGIPLGTHEFTILEKKLITTNKIINIKEGLNNITIPIFQTGKIILDTSEPDAEVFIDGFAEGRLPSTLVLPNGKHKMLIKKENFADYSEDINIEQGNTIEKNVILKEERNLDSSMAMLQTAELADNLAVNANLLALGQLQSNYTGMELTPLNTFVYGGEIIYSPPFTLYKDSIFDFRIGLGGFYEFIQTGDIGLPPIYGLGPKFQILKESKTMPLSLAVGGFWYKDTVDKNNLNVYTSVSRNIGDFSVHLGVGVKSLSLKVNYIRFKNLIISSGAFIDMGLLIPSNLVKFTPLVNVNLGYSF